ncbi:hypothetical protein [Deinococcus sp.]|uniref:hypothetical protein n=1 Tax=Deinococcus sp. TaxID=47478 RepID=UPI00286D73A3|nr:hypothetical protein [Deinococcus sp.]
MTSRTSRSQTDARATFPLVGLQQALESALRLYAAEQSTRPVDEGTFRRLLGHDRQSSPLVRLVMAMDLYGLITRRKNAYALSEGATRLFSSADQGEFRALVYDAALLPQGVRELANTFSARLDSEELNDDLRGRDIAEPDRTLILKVLRENGEFVHQEQRLGELFGRIQALRAERANSRLGRIQDRARWMNTQAGSTANLALVVVMFVGGLTYVAFSALSPERPSSERLTSRSARQSAAPAAVARGPGAATVPTAASTGAARTTGPLVIQPTVSRVTPLQIAVDASSAPEQVAAPTTSAVAQTRVPVPKPLASSAPIRPPVASLPVTSLPVTINEPSVTEPSVALDQPLVTLARGRELAQMLFTQRLSGLWNAFSPSVRREWSGYPAFVAYREDGLKTYGAETGVVAEDIRRSGGISYYIRTAVFERGPRHSWTLILGLDTSGTVVAFNIVAASVLPGLSAPDSR